MLARSGHRGNQALTRPYTSAVQITVKKLVVVMATTAFAAGAAPTGIANAQDSASTSHQSVPIPEPRTRFLDSVSLDSASDGWAVGSSDGSESRPGNHAEHWDGTDWTTVKMPPVGTFGFITGVEAITPDNAWAVGRGRNGGALIDHWDGDKWKIAATTPFNTFLLSVSASSPTDIWAVGWAYATNQEILLHYDGSTWTTVDGASLSSGGLTDVEGRSSTNVWASGFLQGQNRPLVEHNDGTGWSLAKRTSELPADSGANAVSSLRENDTWLAGSYESDSSTVPMLAHWNGSHWQLADVPIDEGQLRDVYMIATDDVWAVGTSGGEALVLHYDGTSWTRVATPNPGKATALTGLDAISSDEVAAVGGYVAPTGARRPLTLRWDGSTWSRS